MIGQLVVILTLYAIGFLFISLFYPKVPFSLVCSSALFWGGLFNTVAGTLLGFLGLYSGLIWGIFALFGVFLAMIHFRTKTRWKNFSLKENLSTILLLFAALGIGFLLFGREPQMITTSATLPMIIVGSRVFHYGTIFLPGGGYDFRSVYGISEALIHALGGFIDQPILFVWHPFLWLSQYAFIFSAIYEYSRKLNIKRIWGAFVGIAVILWTATSPMNWFLLYFTHVHLFASFSVIIFTYLFWQMADSKEKDFDLALLSSLALIGFGLSRVESPIMIFIILAISLFLNEFSRREYRSFFYPLILVEIIWLSFLFIAYRGAVTQYWSDQRLILAISAYVVLLFSLIANEFFRFDLKLGWLRKSITIFLIVGLIVIFALDIPRTIQTIRSVAGNMLGNLQNIGYGSWDLFWIEAAILSVFLLAYFQPWAKGKRGKEEMSIFLNFLAAYLALILLLGFFRTEPYTGIRWGDSGSRMLTHIAPLASVYIGLKMVEFFSIITDSRQSS